MRISTLDSIAADGGRIALWGWGREGRATYRAVRSRLPALPMTLVCGEAESDDARALADPALAVVATPPGRALADFAVVLKSPGISPYGEDAVAAAAAGTRFLGGTALWFGERVGADGRVPGTACITGTKGKSTSTALLAHLLRAGGVRTALAGTIGLPLLELLDGEADAWAIELSSYQTGDVAAGGGSPDVAVVLNLFPEHLDWHGGEARYLRDKLRLVTDTRPRVTVLNAADPRLAALDLPGEVRWFGAPDGWHLRGAVLHRGTDAVLDAAALPLPGRHNRLNLCAVLAAIDALGHDAAALAPHVASFAPLPHRLQPLGRRDGLDWVDDSISTTPHATLAALELPGDVRWFGRSDGWHLRGDVVHRGEDVVFDTTALPLPGRHNRQNLCAVLTAIDALGHDAAALAPHVATFMPLPHRLQPLGRRDGLDWVDDSISTTPHASLAALDLHAGRRVALIVGGHDRGVDWQAFVDAMRVRPPHAIVTTGANGPRIHGLLAPLAAEGRFRLAASGDLAGAVAAARTALDGEGVVLLSPGAPSFGPYRDYTERGCHFAKLAGFDPVDTGAIAGLGVA